MDHEDIPTSKLHEIASCMRRENVEAIGYRCMNMDDSDMDQLNHDHPKDVQFKYEVLYKWAHREGASMGDLKALFVKAIKEGIPVEMKIRQLLMIQPQAASMCEWIVYANSMLCLSRAMGAKPGPRIILFGDPPPS